MASKKNLKKEISKVTGDLYLEILFCALYVPNVDQRKADELLTRALETADDFAARVSHADGKDNPKLIHRYYSDLRSGFKKEIDAINQELSSLTAIPKADEKAK